MKWVRYLFQITCSKKLCLIILTGWILGGLMFLYQSSFFDNREWVFTHLSLYQSNYIQNSLFSDKMIIVMMSVFLFSSSYNSKARNVHLNTTQSIPDITRFFGAKLVVNLFVLSLFVAVLWSIKCVIGMLVLQIPIQIKEVIPFSIMFGTALFFAWMSAMLMFLINHTMSSLLPFLCFWAMEIWLSSKDIASLREELLFPVVLANNGEYIVYGDITSTLVFIVGLYVLMFVSMVRFRRDGSNREE